MEKFLIAYTTYIMGCAARDEECLDHIYFKCDFSGSKMKKWSEKGGVDKK